MLSEAPHPINFTMLLQMFAERDTGSSDDDDVVIAAFNAFSQDGWIDGDMWGLGGVGEVHAYGWESEVCVRVCVRLRGCVQWKWNRGVERTVQGVGMKVQIRFVIFQREHRYEAYINR